MPNRRANEALLMLGFNAANFSGSSSTTLTPISATSVDNRSVIAYEQAVALGGVAPFAQNTQTALFVYLASQGYYVPQFAGDVPSSFSSALINRINAVFADSSFAAGGLIHMPSGVLAIPVTTSAFKPASVPLPSGQAWVFDVTNDKLYQAGASLDGHDKGALLIDTGMSGGFPRFDAGTFSTVAYNSSTGAISVGLQTSIGVALGTLTFTPSADSGNFSTPDGLVIPLLNIPALHIVAESAGTSAVQTLANYLTELGTTTTPQTLDAAHFSALHPTVSNPVTASPFSTVDNGSGTAIVTYIGGLTGEIVNAPSTASVLVNGHAVQETAFNVLKVQNAGVDITRDQLTNVQQLLLPGATNATLTHDEWNGFSSFAVTGTGNGLTFANNGTYDLTGTRTSGLRLNLTAESWLGTTLIGNSLGAEILTASALGDDTLTAGSGGNSTLSAGGGPDTLNAGSAGDVLETGTGVGTLNGGAGSDTFIVTGQLAAGSSFNDTAGNNVLQLNATADLTQATISSHIQTLKIAASVTLNLGFARVFTRGA